MGGYKKILVGLDLSEDSEHVLTKATQIASGFGANITVAHVVEPLTFAYGGDIPIDLSEAQTLMVEQAEKRLAKIASEFDIPPTQCIVSVGHTSSTLHELANDKGMDLIVVGSHGRHGIALLLGSTANGVLKGAECDVLAIRV